MVCTYFRLGGVKGFTGQEMFEMVAAARGGGHELGLRWGFFLGRSDYGLMKNSLETVDAEGLPCFSWLAVHVGRSERYSSVLL